MRATFTPAGAPRADLHHVPGLPPFITMEFKEDLIGGVLTVDYWQPASLIELADAARAAAATLAHAMAQPQPEEGDPS